MKVDAVRELIHCLIEAAHREGTFTESVALEVERKWRKKYRDTEISVSYRPLADREAQRASVVSDYLEGKPINEVTRRNGISRATLYRYLKK